MAKDGTNRGVARPGAGRKPKALADKLANQENSHHRITKLEIPEGIEGDVV